MDLSAELVKKTIEPGSVVLYVNPDFPSDLPHMFVVLNDTSTLEVLLVMVNFTSQIESRKNARAGLPSVTLVELNNGNCPFLTKDSIVDCNSFSKMTLDELVEKNGCGELRLLDSVSDDVLMLLQNGLLASPVIPREIKKLVMAPAMVGSEENPSSF